MTVGLVNTCAECGKSYYSGYHMYECDSSEELRNQAKKKQAFDKMSVDERLEFLYDKIREIEKEYEM